MLLHRVILVRDMSNMSKKNDFYGISIIMAAYNAEKTIKLSIESVINQTYPNWELIIIDDNSMDATGRIVAQFILKDSRITYIKNECNIGVSQTRFKGLKFATNDWIAILDSDDIWDKNKLYEQVCLQHSTEADFIFTGSRFMNGEGQLSKWVLQVPNKVDYAMILQQNIISNSSVLIRKDLYKENYVFEDYIHEDFAMWLRILGCGLYAYGLNKPLLTYRISKTSKTGNKLKAAIMTWKTYEYAGLNLFQRIYYFFIYLWKSFWKYRKINAIWG